MANDMTWYKRLAISLVPGYGAFFAPSEVKAPSRADMQNPLAYVDPSRLTANWAVTPYNPGWLVTRKGLQIYDTMKRDEQVKAALKFKKDSVLASGWEVVSPGDQEEDWEVTRFVQDAMALLPGGWNQVLVDVLSALDFGYSCVERVYISAELGEWKGKLLLTRMQSIRPHYIDFLTDEFGVLKGVIQQLTGRPQEPLPPAKFIIHSHAKEFGNYYGTSDLEAAYRPWWTKDNSYKWLAITLERYGMAPLFAMYDPNSYQGNAVEELKKVVKNIQNASLGVIPRATKDSLELWSQSLNKGSSELFLAALDRFDQHIARAVLVPDLVGMSSNTGQIGSLARSRTNFDSFMQVVTQLQNDVAAQVMNAQVIPQLCDLNFSSLQSYPVFRFLPFSDDRKLEIMSTWAAMVGGQVVNKIEDDETHIRKVMGFPENEDPKVIEAPPPVQPGVGVDAQGKPIKLGPDGQPVKLGPDGKPWKAPLQPGEKKPNPFEKKFEEEGEWKTINGRHVFIREGEDLDTALKRSLGKGERVGVIPDEEITDPDNALIGYVGGGYLEEGGMEMSRNALRRSFDKYPEEAQGLKKKARAFLDRLAPDSDVVELYHVSSSPWRDQNKRGGFGPFRSFTYGKDAALRMLNEDMNGQGWVYTIRVPKDYIGVVVNYNDPNIKDMSWQKEVLNDKPIPLQAVFGAKQFRSAGKKRVSFEQAEDMTEVLLEDQSEEMRTFAVENDAVWVEMDDGQRVAVPAVEYSV